MHRTSHAGAELGPFTSFSVCMFKLRSVFVGSGAGGHEGELGSVLLFYLRAHQTQREYSVELFCILCLNGAVVA